MLTISVWPRRLKEFLLTHPLYKSPASTAADLNAELHQGLLNKGPEMRPRMREGQFGGVDDLTAKVDEVEVNRPGTVPDRPDPSEIILYRMHPTGEGKRIERRLENRHLIEELERGEFRRNTNWLSLNDRTRLHELRFRQGRERSDRLLQIVRPWLNIRPKGDNRPITWSFGFHP